jgi:hypothetical protein
MPDAELTNFATNVGVLWQAATAILLIIIAVGVWRIGTSYSLVHSDEIKAAQKKAQMEAIERSGP